MRDNQYHEVFVESVAGQSSDATVTVFLGTKVDVLFDTEQTVEEFEKKLEDFRHAMGFVPLSEIQINVLLGGGAFGRGDSTKLAFELAEKMIAAWGGCVDVPGFTPSDEWKHKLPLVVWD